MTFAVDLFDPDDAPKGHGEPSMRRADRDDDFGFEVWSVLCTNPDCEHEWSGRRWEACPKCVGLWLDRKIFRELTDRARESTASNELAPENATPPKPGRQQGPLYRRCPQCETMMNRCNFGKRSGVIIDRCREHGFWFDATELARILAWIRDGGEVMSRKRDRLEERQQRSAEKHFSVEKMWSSRYAQGQYTRTRSGGSDFSSILSSLFDI